MTSSIFPAFHSQETAHGGKHRHAAVLQLGFAATTEGLQVTILSHPVVQAVNKTKRPS